MIYVRPYTFDCCLFSVTVACRFGFERPLFPTLEPVIVVVLGCRKTLLFHGIHLPGRRFRVHVAPLLPHRIAVPVDYCLRNSRGCPACPSRTAVCTPVVTRYATISYSCSSGRAAAIFMIPVDCWRLCAALL